MGIFCCMLVLKVNMVFVLAVLTANFFKTYFLTLFTTFTGNVTPRRKNITSKVTTFFQTHMTLQR